MSAPGPTRVVVVEDRLSHAHVTANRVRQVVGPARQRAEVIGAMEHQHAIDHAPEMAARGIDVALVDAMRHPDDLRADPEVMAFAGLEVADAIHRVSPGCRIVGYSANAAAPRVNIVFREVPGVVAVYDQALLVAHMDEVLWGDEPTHQVPPPDDGDYAALGTTTEARIWEALRFVRQRPDTWEAIARSRGNRGVEARTREHLNKYLPSLVPMPDAGTYRAYVELLREIAGFLDRPV